jgi:CRISPR-associated exonuclease Cas4
MIELRVSDLKQFIFCPRYIYFTYVQPVKKYISFKMIDGREEHSQILKKERRRGLKSYGLIEGERLYGYPIYAEKLGIRGKIDMVIDTKSALGQRYYPVECKDSSRGIRNNIKYQLVGYALALEEMTGTPVNRGFIYIIPENKAYEIDITSGRKEYVRRSITMIHKIIRDEFFPEPRSQKRCWNCEMRRYCNDLDVPGRAEKKENDVERMRTLFGYSNNN